MEDPPNSLQREEVNNNDLGRRQEGTSDHHQCWSQFLVGFIHPVWWHAPDDGRLCMAVAVAEAVQVATQVGALCPSKPACCATSTLHSSSMQNRVCDKQRSLEGGVVIHAVFVTR